MELEVKTRTAFGKKTNALRAAGDIPGEIYGHGIENIHVSVLAKEFGKIYRDAGTNTVITLNYEGEKIPVLIADVGFDYVADKPIAVDFHRIRMDEKIRTHVPIILEGKSAAEENGFDLIQTSHECEIEALPNDIPHEFKIDITKLANLGESIHIKDIPATKGVKLITPVDAIIVAVTEKQKEEVEEKPATPEETTPPEQTSQQEEK